MSYTIFKRDNPVFFILCPLLSFVLAVPAFLTKVEGVNHTVGLSLTPYSANFIWGLVGFVLLGNVLAFIAHMILQKHEVFRPMSFAHWIFLFAVLLVYPTEADALPLLTALLFSLLTLEQIIDLYGQKNVNADLFNAGFTAGLASIFFLPFTLLLLVIWFCAFNCRALSFRGIMLSLYGFLCPWALFLAGVYVFQFSLPAINLLTEFHLPTFSLEQPLLAFWGIMLILCAAGFWTIYMYWQNKTLKEKSITKTNKTSRFVRTLNI